MKITGYRTITTVHRWGHPVGDANGVIESGITDIPILIVETDSGIEGIGLGPHPGIERVFPAVDGQDPRGAFSLYDRMLAAVFKTGHAGSVYGAIGVLDMALWDLKAKAADEPLWRTLGATDRFVPGYASLLDIAIPTEELATELAPWVDAGFTGVKLKGGVDLDRDIERLRIAREALSANTRRPALMLDVNESWNRTQAIRHVSEIEREFDLVWIEEPVRRWDTDGLGSVRRGIRAAVASGENLTGVEQVRQLIDQRAVDIVQVGSCWGISHYLRSALLAFGFDLPISPVGYNANPVAAASAALPNHLTTEIQSLSAPVGIGVDQQISDGGIVLGDQPGIGFSVDEKAIADEHEKGKWAVAAGPHVRDRRAGLGLMSSRKDN